MKETTYKCDVCKKPKKEQELTAYLFDYNREGIVIKDDEVLERYEKHICTTCIDIIWAYKER